MTGRAILWVIYKYYRINQEAEAFYNLTDLCACRMNNDGHMEHFLNNWESVLAGMQEEPSSEALKILFYDRVKKSPALAHDIAYYDRLENNHADETYEWLLRRSRRLIEVKRYDANRSQIASALNSSGRDPALPARSGKNGDGKGKNTRPRQISQSL